MNRKVVLFVLSLLLVATFGVKAADSPTTFVALEISNQETMDPHWSYDTASGQIVLNVYENLIRYDGESVTEFLPLLSTKVPSIENGLISADGTTYTFPIREGVEFSNGDPLTPEDVVYSFMRAMIFDRSGGPSWMILEPFTGFQSFAAVTKDLVGVDDPKKLTAEQAKVVYDSLRSHFEINGNNLTIKLPGPYPPFLNILALGGSWSAILDKEWSIKQGAWDGTPEDIAASYNPVINDDPIFDKMMGTGPYKLVEWENGDHVILASNENYWRDQPYFKTVIIRSVDEWNTRKMMLLRGDADRIYVPRQFLNQIEGADGVKLYADIPQLSNDVGIMNWEIVAKGNDYIGSGKLDGQGVPPAFFSDVHVRRGFSYAFNYKAMLDQIWQGDAIRGRGPIVKPLLGFNDNSWVITQDLDKATEEFKQAFGGKLWDKGFKITLLYNAGNDQRKSYCDILKTYIEQINPKFKIKVQGVQWSTYLQGLVAGKWTIGFIGWNADFADPHNFVVPFLGSNGAFSGFKGQNYLDYAKKVFDPKIDTALKETNQSERVKKYEELQQMSMEQATDLWLVQPLATRAFSDQIEGYVPNAMYGPNNYFYDYSRK